MSKKTNPIKATKNWGFAYTNKAFVLPDWNPPIIGNAAVSAEAERTGFWYKANHWITAPWRWMKAAWSGLVYMYEKASALLLVMLAALGFTGQGKGNRIRQFISRTSEEMLAFIYYLSFSDRRAEITGFFEDRVEQILETGAYDRIVVIGYSFGSVVALDAFCPASAVRAPRLKKVDALFTIGCPYDFILTYWSKYFADRQHQPPKTWINIFSPVDLLGTCFDKDKEHKKRGLVNSCGPGRLTHGPTEEYAYREGIPDAELAMLGWIAMHGLSAHSRYWSAGDEAQRTCFDLAIQAIFPTETKSK